VEIVIVAPRYVTRPSTIHETTRFESRSSAAPIGPVLISPPVAVNGRNGRGSMVTFHGVPAGRFCVGPMFAVRLPAALLFAPLFVRPATVRARSVWQGANGAGRCRACSPRQVVLDR